MSMTARTDLDRSLDPVLLARVADFLFHEAELLDDRKFDEWLDLYTADAAYWIPQDPDGDPLHTVQLLLDDRNRLRERVLRVASGFAYSQDPPSRTMHLIGNVRVKGDVGRLDVTSAQEITEVRRGRQLHYVARVRHELVPDGAGSWAIQRKEIRLANGDLPLGNMTFLM